MSPETQPEQPQEVKPARSPYNVLGVAYDYYKEGWDKLWRKDREELKKQVEAQRGIIEKDGLKFKEMKFDVNSALKPEQQLQAYVWKINPLTPKERQFRVTMAAKKGEREAIPEVAKEAGEIKTAEEMVAELPDSKYSKEEKEWIAKYVKATQYVESRETYGILGDEITQTGNTHFGDRALGKYQPMPKNWMNWNKEIFDKKIVEPDRQAQEYVAFRQFIKNYDALKGTKLNSELVGISRSQEIFLQMASRWYGGGRVVKIAGMEFPTGGMETLEYIQSILTEMGIPLNKPQLAALAAAAGFGKARREWNKWTNKAEKEGGAMVEGIKGWLKKKAPDAPKRPTGKTPVKTVGKRKVD